MEVNCTFDPRQGAIVKRPSLRLIPRKQIIRHITFVIS